MLSLRENDNASRKNFQLSRRRQNQSKRDEAETDEREAELDEGHLGPRRAGLFSARHQSVCPTSCTSHALPSGSSKEKKVL